MAKVPPPKKSAKGAPPPPTKTVSNLTKPEPTKREDLSFKVPAEFRREFKIYAATHGMKLNELLFAAFDALTKVH